MRTIRNLQTSPRNGFTLLEMMTATAILVLLVALLAPIFSSLSSTASKSGGKLQVDVLARQALDRIGRDLAQMPTREGLDYFLSKQKGNDEFSFFSSVPGILSAAGGTVSDPASGISLVSYRVNNDPLSSNYMKLERLAVAQPFNFLTFLTYDAAGELVPSTGITQALGVTAEGDYHILCDGVFRFELGFLLKDGSYEPLPMDTAKNPSNPNAPGFREWSPLPHGFARVRVPDGPSNTVFRPLGWQDVAAIVVTLAVIDPASSTRATPASLETAASDLPDAVA